MRMTRIDLTSFLQITFEFDFCKRFRMKMMYVFLSIICICLRNLRALKCQGES